MNRIILMLGCSIVLSFILSEPIQACILVVEVDDVEIEIVTTKKEALVCGQNCLDSAMATVTCPGFACARSVVNGCPSRADCRAPRNPDGTRSALASAYGNCWRPERWTGWIVQAGSLCTATAAATASQNVKVINTTVKVKVPVLRIIWIPWHLFYWVTAFEEGADGNVEITFAIDDLTTGLPLMESTSLFNARSPDLVTDSTGQLMWERFQFHDESTGEIFDNAFRPVEQQQILLAEVPLHLGPQGSIELGFDMYTQSQLLDSAPPHLGVLSTVAGPKILSKTVGIEACLEILPADLNKDCKVDIEDLAILIESWLDEGQML